MKFFKTKEEKKRIEEYKEQLEIQEKYSEMLTITEDEKDHILSEMRNMEVYNEHNSYTLYEHASKQKYIFIRKFEKMTDVPTIDGIRKPIFVKYYYNMRVQLDNIWSMNVLYFETPQEIIDYLTIVPKPIV